MNQYTDRVKTNLYSGNGNVVAIPTDLNYVSQNRCDTDNCDLWEEQEAHWYSRMAQRSTLAHGTF